MHALAVLRKLVGRNSVWLHIVRVAMTPSARLGDISGKYRSIRILDGLHAVSAMATDARGGFWVALCDLPSMHTRGVFHFLVHANGRIVLLHHIGIAVTLSTESLHLPRR